MTPAQSAKAAHYNAMRGRDAAGQPLPTWSQLSAAERQAWQAAADAAVLAWREREKEKAS